MTPALFTDDASMDDCLTAALRHLRQARDLLTAANAPRAADRVRGALKSAEGALRHAERVRCPTCRGQGRLDNPHDLLGTETCPACAGTGRVYRHLEKGRLS